MLKPLQRLLTIPRMSSNLCNCLHHAKRAKYVRQSQSCEGKLEAQHSVTRRNQCHPSATPIIRTRLPLTISSHRIIPKNLIYLMHSRSLGLDPHSARISPYNLQTLPRTCRANLPFEPRNSRSTMLALSMGLISKLGWKGNVAVAGKGNDFSAPSTSDAADQALQGTKRLN
jgi:hypothetical protein